MRILISGAGIAGPTLAYWLLKHGFEPTLLERAPKLRTGGYVIDFWGTGYDIAEQMGLAPLLQERGYRLKEVRMVGDDGQRVSGFPVEAVARLANDRFVSIPRGEWRGRAALLGDWVRLAIAALAAITLVGKLYVVCAASTPSLLGVTVLTGIETFCTYMRGMVWLLGRRWLEASG